MRCTPIILNKDEVCVCVLGNQAEILLLVPHPVPPLLLVPPRIQMQLRLWLCRGKLLDRPSLGREEHHPLGHLGLRASEGETPARDEVQQALRTRREMGWRGREFARVRCVSERERDREEREWSRGHLRPRPHLLLLQSVWYTARAIAEEERKQEASAKEVGFSSSLWSEKLTKEVQVDEDGLPHPERGEGVRSGVLRREGCFVSDGDGESKGRQALTSNAFGTNTKTSAFRCDPSRRKLGIALGASSLDLRGCETPRRADLAILAVLILATLAFTRADDMLALYFSLRRSLSSCRPNCRFGANFCEFQTRQNITAREAFRRSTAEVT